MENFLSLLLFASVAGITPGPNNIMIMASGLNYGYRASMPHYLGICLGFPLMFIAIGLGLGYIFQTTPVLHITIKVLGILYLLYLALLIARAESSNEQVSMNSKPQSFYQAALFQWVNPKAWVMGSSAIATYSNVGADLNSQILMIVATFSIITFPCVACWLFFGAKLKNILKQDKQRIVVNRTMALLLVLSITPILFELFQSLLLVL